MNNTNSHVPALPTHPFQDKLGQVIINFGLSKLEYAAIHIAGTMAANGDLHPETIAQQAVLIANEIFGECENDYKELQPEQPSAKILKL